MGRRNSQAESRKLNIFIYNFIVGTDQVDDACGSEPHRDEYGDQLGQSE